MESVAHISRKAMQRLGGNLVGILGLTCLCACQTTGPEPAQSEGHAVKTVQTETAPERKDPSNVNYQNTVDKTAFYDLPRVTNWAILSLADFNFTREIPTPSGGRHTYKLGDHRVEATIVSNSAVLFLSKIPSCEGAFGRQLITGAQKWKAVGDGFKERLIDYSPTGIEYVVLQGACSEIVFQSDGTRQELPGTYADMIMFNLIPNLGPGHMWDLDGDRLILLDAEGRERAEFLRVAGPN